MRVCRESRWLQNSRSMLCEVTERVGVQLICVTLCWRCQEEEECSTEESEDEEPTPRRRGKKPLKGAQDNPAECKQQ